MNARKNKHMIFFFKSRARNSISRSVGRSVRPLVGPTETDCFTVKKLLTNVCLGRQNAIKGLQTCQRGRKYFDFVLVEDEVGQLCLRIYRRRGCAVSVFIP